VKLLLAGNKNAATKAIDLMALSASGETRRATRRQARPRRAAARSGGRPRTPGLDRGYLINEQVHTQGVA
jgi:hypothetical protein